MIHKTSAGKLIDMNQFKLQHETELAVGNARVNARGDRIGTGGQIVQTRDEITKEFYVAQQGSPVMNNLVVTSSDEMFLAQADQIVDSVQTEPVPVEDPFKEPEINPDLVVSSAQTEALAKSQALAERLKAQRKKANEENKSDESKS
jgi:hypothetical protein